MKESDIRPRDIHSEYLALSLKDLERYFSDQSGFVSVLCPACGSDKSELGLIKQGFRYRLCGDCGTLYLSPRPSREQLMAFYKEAESVKYWSTHFYKQTAAARRRKMFVPRAKLTAKILGQLGSGDDVKLIDVGAGYGMFLEEMKKTGVCRRLAGIEPDPEMAKVCRNGGFDILEQWVEDVDGSTVLADIATAFEVLEHVYDPRQFLMAIASILKPNGMMLLTTLTVSGFDIQVLWEHSKGIYPPHHINMISVEGMRRLLARSGFVVKELSTPGKLDIDIVINTLREDPSVGVPRFVSEIVMKGDDNVKKAFQKFLSDHLLSSHLRVLAAKS